MLRNLLSKPLIAQGKVTICRTANLIDQAWLQFITKQFPISCLAAICIWAQGLINLMRLHQLIRLALRIGTIT